MSKFNNFNLFDFIFKIRGFVRFECEIKKRKLIEIYQRKNIRIENVKYSDLENVWSDEFMKILKFKSNDEDMKRIVSKDEVKKVLYENCKACKANRLYSFFINVLTLGYDEMKNTMNPCTFYRSIRELKELNVDFSQSSFSGVMKLDFDNIVNFNPFTAKEVV